MRSRHPFLSSRCGVAEIAAIKALKALDTSAVMYSTTYGGISHPISVMDPSAGSNASSSGTDLIDWEWLLGSKEVATKQIHSSGCPSPG